MKKRKSRITTKRLILFLTMTFALTTIGVSYAAWNSELRIGSTLTTDQMNVIFQKQPKEKYKITLVDPNDAVVLPVDAKIEWKDDDKIAEIIFEKGLPMKELCAGKRIKLEVPLKGKEDSLSLFQEKEVDFNKPEEEKISVKAERGILAVGSQLYEIPDRDISGNPLRSVYMQDLQCNLYRGLMTREHENTGILYLELTAESIQKVEKYPQTVWVGDAALVNYSETSHAGEKIAKETEDGIVITYSCEIPVFVDQKESPSLGSEGGK